MWKKIRLIKLKRCPTCRAMPGHIKMLRADGGGYYIKCSKCGAYTDIYSRWTDSVAVWNSGQV